VINLGGNDWVALTMQAIIALGIAFIGLVAGLFAKFLLIQWIIQHFISWAYQRSLDAITDWLKGRPIIRAMFKHYTDKHPQKNPRVCDVDACKLVPAKRSRSQAGQ
jgi:hypothetical protein